MSDVPVSSADAEPGDAEAEARRRMDILQRIAALEERTRPKRPRPLEILQSYGGIAALVISLLYSFPLGLWDRFIIDPGKKEDAAVAELRTSLREIYRLSSEMGRVAASTTEPFSRDAALRGLNNQIHLIVTNNNEQYERYRDRLSAEELISVGLAHQSTANVRESVKFFTFAKQKGSLAPLVEFEINRQIAKSYFLPYGAIDATKGRGAYREALTRLGTPADWSAAYQVIMLKSEWGLGELMSGDWKCGQQNMDEAAALLARWQFAMNDGGNLMRMLELSRSQQQHKPGQLAEGCP